MTTPANPPNPDPGATPASPPVTDPAAQQPGAIDIQDVIRKTVEATRNSLFAELRRDGKLPDKKTKTPAPDDNGNPPPQSVNFRALDRAVANRPLSESAYKRLESAFAAEAPDDVSAWVKDYFEGFGATANAAPAAGGGTPNASPGNAVPNSNGSPPPPPKVPVEERKVIGATQAEVEYLTKTKGAKWVAAKYRAELATLKVSLKK